MILLKREEKVERYQVEIALRVKTKQSPFIAILILAHEQGNVSSESLRQTLLPTLPKRACYNLLTRLKQQGYLESDEEFKLTDDLFREALLKNRGNIERAKKYLDNFINSNRNTDAEFILTDIGSACALEKSIWVGEKGIFNVFVCNSVFIDQPVIKIEKVHRPEDDKGENKVIPTPAEIRQIENEILQIGDSEIQFESIEAKCFRLQPIGCDLEIRSVKNEATVNINKDGQLLLRRMIGISESNLEEQLLLNSEEVDYSQEKQAVLVEFDRDDLSFKRLLKINSPNFKKVVFKQVDLENVPHIPIDQENADLWLREVLYRNIDTYFFDEKSFSDFANKLALPIKQYYNIVVPDRKKLIEFLTERGDAFYQSAKLDAIEFLNY